MINVTFTSNTSRQNLIVSEATPLRDVIEQSGIAYDGSLLVMLDSANIRPGDMNKTLSELGVVERCALSVIQKRDNATN